MMSLNDKDGPIRIVGQSTPLGAGTASQQKTRGTSKQQRQDRIVQLLRKHTIVNQQQLLEALLSVGIETNQSSISRDLTELNVQKVRGAYRLPSVESPSYGPQHLEIWAESAGPHLLVLKTQAGRGSLVALTVDQARLSDVVGTIAGDDTVFVALRDDASRDEVLQQIIPLFRFESR